eukprot:CAMPEP_0202835176 /NCGR_PEP_ID=MMETSP1389-20130828/35571_1 /ASSEMBLY_ACC=CAM_ASM_000865 /TAXON_ID=302021 /ORGANISM="Rhodomonas sp., Strain CCMP768" /LENGTH=31 /DNA_ID= /DNA_START= /DNA_END= /DNA_ORIENTATION=
MITISLHLAPWLLLASAQSFAGAILGWGRPE